MHTNNYSLEVLVNGRSVREYAHEGKTFVEAREGTEYSLRFTNNTWNRVMAVFSVDGVDVLHGKSAGEAENGYVIPARSSVEIKGYRMNDALVAAFRFGSGFRSYAAVVGSTKKDGSKHKTEINNGVIGVRVFEEKSCWTNVYWTSSGGTSSATSTWQYNATTTCSGYNPTEPIISAMNCSFGSQSISASCSQPAPSFDLGTSWGKQIEDRVATTTFEKSGVSYDLVIYYASRKALENYGIDFSSSKKIMHWPEAFGGGFCQPPPGYVISG